MSRPDRTPRGRSLGIVFYCVGLLATTPAPGSEPEAHPFNPPIAPASVDAGRSSRAIRLPKGLKAELYASEPLLANPVAFGFDERGRAYVVETFRLHKGVTDNRGHMNWLDDDIASRTVADRVAMYRKHLGKDFETYGTEHDRIRLLEDRDGDGKADRATVFADGFKGPETGLAAGILARRGDVWFTCIPDLWLLRDRDGDGKADERTSLQTGYGVHVALLGHDLHGLCFGPDGKLYFSIGDRGLNVRALDGRTAVNPDSGAVLRCEPDGTGLELYATGLRNPQELVFDRYGNLFSVDNNSDSGDKARVVSILEGGDSGWRVGFQYLEAPVSRGPWNAEKLWHPHWDGQAAFLLPPLANLSDGPSGLTIEPGTSLLPEKYREHLFLADFRGGSGGSGVRSFALQPKGASFEVVDKEEFAWSVLATDVDFGPDGALYVSDWTEGWRMPMKGRIHRVTDPSRAGDPAVRRVKELLAEGVTARPAEELAGLLAHPDKRVRQEAQFALAERGGEGLAVFRRIAHDSKDTLPRVHAVWGLGQIGRRDPGALEPAASLLADADSEVRAQAARVLGETRDRKYGPALAPLLRDDSPRVRLFAAIGLGKVGGPEAVGPLLTMLRENADRDPYLRHAAVMGLAGAGDPEALLAAAADSSAAVRTGVLLALRRLGRAEVARFLDDAEVRIAAEAARAIYDVPIPDAYPALAALVGRPKGSEPLGRRAMNAAAHLGRPEDASALAALAGSADAPEALRVEALHILADWPKANGRDRVLGLWRPRAPRPAEPAASALGRGFAGLVKDGPDAVRIAAIEAAGPLRIDGAADVLLAAAEDKGRSGDVRVAALKGLERLDDPRLADAVKGALHDRRAKLRVEGQRLLAKLSPAQALPVLESVLDGASTAERQGAFAVLGGLPGPEADRLLVRWLDRLRDGQAPPEVALDLVEAARTRKDPEVKARLEAIDAARPKGDPTAPYRETLRGGDAERGWKIFAENASVTCIRCHKARDQGGEVGPNLKGVAGRGDRRYLLESIVAPNAQIAKGFETVVVALADGQVISGVLKEDGEKSVRLVTPEGKAITVAKDDIEERKRGPSAMPDDLTKHLSKAQIRDLVEFLAGLK